VTARRRWDTDERGIGVGDARAWTPVAETIVAVTTEQGWVAEEPELHLLPHLEAASVDGPLRIRTAATTADGTFEVELEWAAAAEPTRRAVRSALFALVGTIAETVTVLHEPPGKRGRVVEILTGSGGGPDGAFARHGHTVRLHVLTASEPSAE
jgi:hypothetical protein